MPTLLDRFERHIGSLLDRNERVLVGYSGGADSTCLLHLLWILKFDAVAGHLHHGQRSEADTELKLCEAFCQELDVPFLSGHADVPGMASDLKIGLEEAGRKARYTFLSQAAFRTESHFVATAHTRSDLVETVLLNLARGSGLKGLGGIPEQRGNIIRPLLPFSREETRGYCVEHGLWFHDDPANVDVNFARSRIRHTIVPELRKLNDGFDMNVARLASTAREEDEFLNGMAAAALEQSEADFNGELAFLSSDVEVAFDLDRLGTLPGPLLKRALRLAVEAIGGSLDHHQTLSIVQRLATGDPGSVTAEGGRVVAEWDERQLHIRQLTPDLPFRYPLTIPGETISDEFGWQFVAFRGAAGKTIRKSMEVFLDPAEIKGALFFRTFKEGDLLQPLGFDGHRHLSDLLSEAKLTQAARHRLPIVCDMVGPIWAPGVCVGGRAIANEGLSDSIVVRFESLRELRRS